MAQMKMTHRFDAPIDTVFAACTDFAGLAERLDSITQVEMLTDGSTGVGTRFRETRVIFGKKAVEEMEVSDYEKNRSFTLQSISCGCEYHFRHDFRAEGTSTVIDMEMQTRPLTFFAKLMSPIGKLMIGSMRKLIERDMDQLRESLEGTPAATSN